MTTDTIYISGPMRTVGPPDYNHDQFCSAEAALLEWRPDSGIFNPARNFGGNKTFDVATYMKLDLHQVLWSDIIILLPRWTESEGATLEARVGLICGKEFYIAYQDGDDWEFAEVDKEYVSKGIDNYEMATSGAYGIPQKVQVSEDSPRASVLNEARSLITGDRN